ncbi:putative cytochrome P450 monooxygenase [Cadophora sp. MPI-SDFR-AT-0126]|nr:putative cytochrome P450 monooxygenase [Leotiomycetes sp. MPI-SDFR-AT-0126]
MTNLPYAQLLFFAAVLFFILYPIVQYFRDPKRLRRFHNMSPLSGLSAAPFMIVAHGGFRSKYLEKLHQEYPVIRTGPNSLSYGDPRAIKDIYGHNTKCKKDELYTITMGSHFHLADVVDNKEHSRKRKVLSSAYALKNLESWEHKVADKTERLITHFDRMCTAPLPKGQKQPHPDDLNVDYRAWTNFFTIEAIADIGLSERLGFLDTGSDLCSAEKLDGTTYEVGFRDALYQNARKQSLLVWNYDWYPFINKLVDIVPFYRRMSGHARDWDAIYLSRSSRRLKRYEAGEKLDDFFQALMEDKNGSPNNLEWGEIVAEVGIMMNAGSATTAIAMANVMFQLLKNPTVMEKLRAEVDSVLDDHEVVASYDKIKHLPYLRACLDESLRLFPPTSHGLTRAVPPEGMDILGEYIPGGTSVSISAYVAHRDESIFPMAEKFIPERWLGEEGKRLQPYFLAFSAGARGCIGRNISYLEQTVLLASVLHRYEFALPSPDWEIKRLETMNLILGEMPVKVWRRRAKERA